MNHTANTGIQWSISDWLLRGRTLNSDAVRLNGLILSRLPPGNPVRTSFAAWYEAWKPFYEKYIGEPGDTSFLKSLSQSNVSLNYEEFDQALLRHKQQFDAIARAGGFQPIPDRPETGKDASGLPWWFWLGSGVALVGAGYLVYKKYQEAQGKLAWLDAHSPAIIDTFVPGGQGKNIKAFSQAGRRTARKRDTRARR